MQYRSFVNNYSIDKLQICIKGSVINIAEHYVRAKSSPTFLCYYIVLCKFVEMQMRLDMMKIRAFKNATSFLSVLERLFVSPTIISASLVPAIETHLWEQIILIWCSFGTKAEIFKLSLATAN